MLLPWPICLCDTKKPIQRGGWIGFVLLRSLAGLFGGETLVGVQADFDGAGSKHDFGP